VEYTLSHLLRALRKLRRGKNINPMDSPPGIRTSELEKEFGVHKVISSGSLLLVAGSS
jgi:hypothetical protein